MIKKLLQFIQIISFLFITSSLARASTPLDPLTQKVVQLARHNLGSEAALLGVQTLQSETTILDKDGVVKTTLSMQMKKPFKQRLIWVSEAQTFTAITDGTIGFSIVEQPNTPSIYEMLPVEATELLIVGTLENLYFYTGSQHRFGTIAAQGPFDWKGHSVYKLLATYGDGSIYTTFLDAHSGNGLAFIDRSGLESVIETSVIVDGIKFPSKIKTYDEHGNLYSTVLFDKYIINEPLDDSLFEIPSNVQFAD